jgi:hypothetical protein
MNVALEHRGGLMPTDTLWRAPDIVPAITYSDVPGAVEWLARVFGFHERAHARLTWPGGGMAWMVGGEGSRLPHRGERLDDRSLAAEEFPLAKGELLLDAPTLGVLDALRRVDGVHDGVARRL